MTAPVLALDVGGTKLAAGLVDEDGQVLADLRVPTPAFEEGEGDLLWATVAALLSDARGGTEVSGVGIGCGGPMRWPAGEVSPLNIPAWRDYPLRDRVAQAYPDVPVRLHNDAVCFVAAEHWRGAARGRADVLGVVVSAGVGGGLVLGGRLVDGPSGNAGHVGHLVVEPEGPACSCGGQGCLEAVASGPSTVRWALGQGWQPSAGVEPDGRALAAAAQEGDELAVAALGRSGAAVGVAIASVAHLLEVTTVVVGGGLASSGEPFWGPLRTAVDRHARLPYVADLDVRPAARGPLAGLVGAAALVAAVQQESPGAGGTYWTAD